VNHRDDVSGALALGMLADLAVLDRDPVASGHIRDASVAMTVVGGLVVFEEV
jgi:predicted amidohydrolase YtcJ